jgi:uncharacterized protein YecE (DUF72 family)
MILVGTSGWQYDSWKGSFYPADLPKRAWLAHYATLFPVVEVNNSFYRLPTEETFERWRAEVPGGFSFVVKASRYITHIRRLRDCKDSVDQFWSRAARLGDKLGPVLFQLPPNFKADPGLLGEFLAILPEPMRAALEFRHDSWRRDDVIRILDDAGAAWVLADRPGWRVPLVVTGGWSYIRFHQGRRILSGYTRSKLRTWAERIADLDAEAVYAFFNNDPMAAAPADAATLIELLAARGQEVRRVEPDPAVRGESRPWR